MHIILYMLLSLNWEGESIQLQYLGRLERENGFKVQLACSTGFFAEYILSFHGLAGFCRAQLEGICYLLSKKFISVSSPGVSAWDSHVLLRRPPSWKLNSFFLFPLTKKATSVFRVLANHSASFSFFILSGDSFGLLSLSTRVRLWSTDSLTYILISSFNGQPLGPVHSNTEG